VKQSASLDAQGETPVKCLVVDDIAENLVALEALLHRDDLLVLQARSGTEALELLLEHGDIALALLDVQMPEMNGFELAEMIRGRERTRHIPLIFITAGSQNIDWQFKGYDAGAVDFLYKPIDPHMLLSKVEVFFTLHRQKRALARELAERTEALRINEMFMAVLSHDLRTPLTSVTLASGALVRACTDEKSKALATRILSSARRMDGMIEDLLDLTRIRQHGSLSLQPTALDLGELCAKVVEELRDHSDREVVLSSAGDLSGSWDGDRLAQVLTNLLGNAQRHGAADQPIGLHLDGTQKGTVRIETSNGGCIPAELLPVLFEPFRGGETKGGRRDGLGLGLYIVQQIVSNHGGSLEVHSADHSTRFTVTLPRNTGQPLNRPGCCRR